MQLDYKKVGDILVVKALNARIDVKVAMEFKEEMIKLIANGNRSLVLDLSKVDFIDSSGLGAIISCLKQIGGKGDLVICGIREAILSLFRLTRLDRILRIFSNETDAIADLSG